MIPTQARQPVVAMLLAAMFGCGGAKQPDPQSGDSATDTQLTTTRILVTSEAGDTFSTQPNVSFSTAQSQGVTVTVDPASTQQTLLGVGTSFTESSAYVLAHLPDNLRREVMEALFSDSGANFSMARTPIGSTDFSVEGKYSYADSADTSLARFSIDPDREGFSRERHPHIVNESYDLLPMIHEAQAIKAQQSTSDLRIIASAWTAPPWMKTIDDWYIKGSPENNWQGTGGALKPGYESVYADYLIRYLDAYNEEGVTLWGLTPVNEPHGNSGNWESMHFTPQTQNTFIQEHLGPKLSASKHDAIKLLIYDQNRDDLEAWTDVMFADPDTAPYLYGAALHWYSSTFMVYEDIIQRVREKYPSFALIHTEGTIDDLGKPAPGGVLDTALFEESNWFNNDAFWWNANATDWAYTATWAPNVENHPIYTPVHRYARDIVVGFNHGLEGWIDWNAVLDADGGPNHVGNFCGAPVMIDIATQTVYYTPVFHVLKQLSRTIRPGDVAVKTSADTPGLSDDALHASASVNAAGLLSVQLLNTTKSPIAIALTIGEQSARIQTNANSLTTVQVALD